MAQFLKHFFIKNEKKIKNHTVQNESFRGMRF